MKKYILMAAAVVLAIGAQAQRQKNKELDSVYYHCNHGHYVSAQVGYGLQDQTYSFTEMAEGAKRNNDLGISFKFGYKYYFTDHFGVGLSAMYQNYQAKTTFNFTNEGAPQQTPYGVGYIPVTVFDDLRERQSLHTVSIPVQLLGQFSISKRWKTEIGLGAAYTLAMAFKYKTVDGSIEGREVFPELNGELNYEYERYDTYKVGNFKGDYNKNNTLSALGEVNFLFSLSRRLELGIGFMGMYGFSSPNDNGTMPIYENGDQQRQYNGVLNTNYVKDNGLMSAQVTVGLRYRIFARNVEFESKEQSRHLKDTKQVDMMNQSRHQFDTKNKKHKQDEVEIDTLSDEERRRRAIRDANIKVDLPQDTVVETPAAPVEDVPAPPAAKTLEQEIEELIMELNDNYCGFNSAPMANQEKQQQSIDRLAEILRQHPEVELVVYGHTCDIGTVDQNKIVGQRRADGFKYELTKRGVPARQITTETKWFKEPLVPNTTPANRAKNRRIQLKKVN
ncbi:MAG: OmpA family protein [Bacteroidales bacterium]|nr:OmpA family protein [Bacteroidales bacterium]